MPDIFNYLFDAVQNVHIRRARKESTDARHKVSDARIDIASLQRDHEKLKLITIALWELLKEHTSLTDSALKAYVEQVDEEDGRRDGKASTKVTRHTCDDCGHSIPTSALACAYCGVRQRPHTVF
jgi:hypothetical protein